VLAKIFAAMNKSMCDPNRHANDGDEAEPTHSSSIHHFTQGIGHAAPPGLVL
jgi:hypothetical protein